METDRYARQTLIEWWDQPRLRAARVLIAGVGALGNEVAKNLTLLGVGHLTLIDLDRVEASNLSRTMLFDEADVEQPKAAAAVRALARLNPHVTVNAIDGDVFYDLGLGRYRHSQLVIGCLDNLAARSQVGVSCALAGVPYLDGGMWSLGGEARWFPAGDGPCFDCTLSEDDLARASERRSCSGYRLPPGDEVLRVPTVATTAAIIGGLLAQEAAKWLCGYPVLLGTALVYNGQALSLHRAELTRRQDCPSSHTPYQAVVELPERAATLTPRQLLSLTRASDNPIGGYDGGDDWSIELGRDFLIALNCPACGRREAIGQPWGQIAESRQPCPACGALRTAEALRSVDQYSPFADQPLASLGVPLGDVVAVRSPAGLRLYELTGDLDL